MNLSRTLLTFAALALSVALQAETVDWSLGKAIDCPLPVATPGKALSRTLVFPGGPITDIPNFWTDEQLFCKIIRNTVVLQLRDASFAGTMQVYDDKGNLFLVNVHAARPSDTIDESLSLRQVAGPGEAAGAALAADSDGQVSDMMAHMVAGGGNPSITGALVTHVDENGKVVVGRRIFADDALSIELIKVYQGGSMRGYECVMRYRGTHTVRLDQQRLWFPGALAVYASNQLFVDPQTVTIDMQPNQAIKVYYVAE